MFEWIGCDAAALPGLVDNRAVFSCFKHWTTCLEYRFRVPKQEAEALVSLVRRLVGTGMRSRRVLVAMDSRVSMSALAKGHSAVTHSTTSAKQLSKLCLFAKLALELVWTPSDAPSRCGLVESLRASPVLPWRPLRISEIPSSAFLGGPGSQSSRPSALPTLGGTSIALSGRQLTGIYGDWVTRNRAIRDVVSDHQTSRVGTFAFHPSCGIRTCNLQMRTRGQPAGRPCQSLGLGFTRQSSRPLRVTSLFSYRAESFLFTSCSPTGAFQLEYAHQ